MRVESSSLEKKMYIEVRKLSNDIISVGELLRNYEYCERPLRDKMKLVFRGFRRMFGVTWRMVVESICLKIREN